MNKVRIGLYKSIAKSDTCVHVTFPEDSCGGILNELMGIMHMLNRNIESGRLRQYAGAVLQKRMADSCVSPAEITGKRGLMHFRIDRITI